MVATIFQVIRLPHVVGFLVAGVIVGPSGLGWLKSIPQAENLAEIAAVLLMFTIGLEFSFRKLIKFQKSFLTYGLLQVSITLFLTAVIVHLVYDFSWHKSLFIGYLVSLSSTAIVLKLIHDNRHTTSPHGQTTLSILLFQDLAVIPMLLSLPFLAGIEGQMPGTNGSTLILKILVLVGALVLFARYIIPFLLEKVAHTGSREVFFFCVLFICAGSAFAMHEFSLSYSLGAFIAGVIISESPYGKQATSEFLPLRDNFLGLFFVSIGMLLDLGFLMNNFGSVMLVALAVILVKFAVISSVVWFFGHSAPLAKMVALSLFQIGEFSFLLAEQGLRLNLMNRNESQHFIAAAVLSLGLTPFFYRMLPKMGFQTRMMGFLPNTIVNAARDLRSKWNPVRNQESNGKDLSGHTIIIGFGVAGQNVARALKTLKVPYTIVEMNAKSVKDFGNREPIIFGDATQDESLESANIGSAKLGILTIPGAEAVDQV
ncbi:MAG: cation:proton antiporter, partial [Bdellovibrionales bacterium]|nr:cation:proton antiporter [Bdellovibrionales bacterium]